MFQVNVCVSEGIKENISNVAVLKIGANTSVNSRKCLENICILIHIINDFHMMLYELEYIFEETL